MSALFEALPGIEVPVGEINQRLSAMWSDTAASGGAAPTSEDAKATQVNFVLHLGFRATPEDAVTQFQTAVRFSRRHPSRIVVLCPIADEAHSGQEMRAKIYGECFLGKSKEDKRCVEFVLLSYPQAARRFLEDQVSICLVTDLPMYYWAHRFSASGRLADYRYLLNCANRVVLDSAVAPDDALTYPWPHPENLRDLTYSRLLPIRQSIGQFLASYPPGALGGGLASVTISHSPDLLAEARSLAQWAQQRLRACGTPASVTASLGQTRDTARNLGMAFSYSGSGKMFKWSGDLESGHAMFEAKFGDSSTRLAAAVSLLSPENALSDAIFF